MNTKEKKSIPTLFLLILFLTLFTSMALLTMYQPIWANIPFNIIIPIVLLVAMKMVFFERLKLSTLICMRLLVVVTYFNLFSGETCIKIVLILWMINILEATLTDLSKKHFFNTITGLALTISLFTFFTKVNLAGWNGIYYTIFYNGNISTICWIAAYTIWNWVFVSYEFSPSIAKLHIAILASPILGALLVQNPGIWFILRGNSLTTGAIVEIAFKEKLENSLKGNKISKIVEKSHNTSLQIALMIISLLLIIIPLVIK